MEGVKEVVVGDGGRRDMSQGARPGDRAALTPRFVRGLGVYSKVPAPAGTR